MSVCPCVQAFNPRTQEARVGISLCVPDLPGLHSDFQASQRCIEKPCLKITTIITTREILSNNTEVVLWLPYTPVHLYTTLPPQCTHRDALWMYLKTRMDEHTFKQ